MRVAFLMGGMNRGGTESLLLDIARCRGYADFEMVFVHRRGGDFFGAFSETGVRLEHIAVRKVFLFSYLLRLRRVLVGSLVTHVHCHQVVDVLYAWLATLFYKCEIVMSVHGFVGGCIVERLLHFVAFFLSDKVCFVSEAERGYFMGRYGAVCERSYVVYNGVDVRKIRGCCIGRGVRNSGCRGIRLGMVGNFTGGKSQKVIVRALCLLWERGVRGFDFFFIGGKSLVEPWLYEECVRLGEGVPNVHFLGSRGDVPELLCGLDGFCYSSVCDTFGIAVVEAMVAGVPVVVNDWVSMLEVTNHGEWADVYRSGDIVDCADRIEGLLWKIENGGDDFRVRLVEIAERVSEVYSIEGHLRRLAEVYRG